MKDLGRLHYCLGTEFSQDEGKLKMSRVKYIDDLLRKFNMQDAKTVTTPMDPNQKLTTEMCPKNDAERSEMEDIPYQTSSGSLMYLSVSSYQIRHHTQRECPKPIQQQYRKAPLASSEQNPQIPETHQGPRHRNYKFYKEYETSEGLKWRCTTRKCNAKIYTNADESTILKSDLSHNHLPDPDKKLSLQIVTNSSKRKATENISERPSKVIRQEISDKCSTRYEEVFKILVEQCGTLGRDFKPQKVVCDFEEAIHIAVEKVWPETEIVGCRFHLTQSWWRKIQEFGLTKEYKDEDSEIGKWLRLHFSLPLLPPEEVSEAFVDDLMTIQPRDPRTIRFSDYLTDTYVAEEARFPPHIWASNTMDSDRTTNACESFHSHFNETFENTHPNIFVFTEKLKEFHIQIYVLKQSVGIPYISTNKKYLKKKNIMEKLLHRYNLIISCRMNFLYYPMDTQLCFITMTLLSNGENKVILHWKKDTGEGELFPAIRFANEVEALKYRIDPPKTYKTVDQWTTGNYTVLYANFTFVRLLSGSLLNTYVPSTLIVCFSWLSFWLEVTAVPARVTLGATSLLTLVTQMVQSRQGLPPISYMTAMDIWLFACLLTVFGSLLAFAFSSHFHVLQKSKNSSQNAVHQTINSEAIGSSYNLRIRKSTRFLTNQSNKIASKILKAEKTPQSAWEQLKDAPLDKYFRIAFPLTFTTFALIYWTFYLSYT
ncbi:hypothetical protein JTE90_007399 [Oedothorax gibbosus]|uniref:Uncharacterized protein n=1 Tax=Oedothorax gibbosus TaxID=931172 RepID=A0AAV6TW69_9ARAC|nr:hypothetical protein JTE90_007399 [Oedothorax gibbosus]